MPIMGSPGSTVVEVDAEVEVAETAGRTARGQMRIRKNKRMPAHKGSCLRCLLWRLLRAIFLLAMVSSVLIGRGGRLWLWCLMRCKPWMFGFGFQVNNGRDEWWLFMAV
jgi:hypothetical protein